MSQITLIMTRKPLEEVNFGKKNGRWGRMVVVKGGQVFGVRNIDASYLPDLFSPAAAPDAAGTYNDYCTAGTFPTNGLSTTAFRVGQQGYCVDSFGGIVEVIGKFDTLERFRTDSKKSYYVQLEPRPSQPYEIRMDISQNVKELNTTGKCFRVHGHNTKNSSGGRAGILIHEAPHPGWLIGCIGPRPSNYRTVGHDKGPSRSAMETIFGYMGGFSKGKKAALVTLDW